MKFSTSLIAFAALLLPSAFAKRPVTAPKLTKTCETELDCPGSAFCYDTNYYMKTIKPRENADLIALGDSWEYSGIENKPFNNVCMCYSLFGIAGVEPYDWEPTSATYLEPLDGGTNRICRGDDDRRNTFFLGVTLVCGILAWTSFILLLKTAYQLSASGALEWNVSGQVLFYTTMAELFLSILYLLYLIFILGEDKDFFLLDNVRPVVFSVFAIFLIAALLEISLMWAEVYSKSQSMGKAGGAIGWYRVFIYLLVFLSAAIIGVGMFIGQTSIAALYMFVVLTIVGFAYLVAGRRLADTLAPIDDKAPGANSAIAASNEIRRTSKAVAIMCFVFILLLLGYSVSLQRRGQEWGFITWLFVNGFLVVSIFMANRIMNYIRFGNRKKLAKAGYLSNHNIWLKQMKSSDYENTTSSQYDGPSRTISHQSSYRNQSNVV